MTSSPDASPSSAMSGTGVPQLSINTSDAVTNGNNLSNGNGAARRTSQATSVEPTSARPDIERADSQGPGEVPMSAVSQTGNGRKRSNTDGVEYPRRRATIACEVCRSRKSRCDGSRPKCRLCIELNAECIYREPGIKLDAGDKLILEHLNRIENLLQNALPSTPPGSGMAMSASPAISHSTNLSGDGRMAQLNIGMSNNLTSGMGAWSNIHNISSMPKNHSTPALNLLQWPKINHLVSLPYSPETLLQVELERPPLQFNTSMNLDLSNTNAYVQAYFERVNVWYAVVNPYNWTSLYKTALSQGFRTGPESCVVLLVLALGQASTRGSISRVPIHEDPPGMSYFSAAWALLPSLMTRTTMLSAQCMILTSAYLFYLVRPLEAWTLLSSISMKLQLLLTTNPPALLPTSSRELSERVFWNALLFESDLLAELDLPHSGIVTFEESIGLPCGFEIEDEDSPAGVRDDLWYFLAEIALRRLLNRVSHLIYSEANRERSISSLGPIVGELDYQLTQWYESLPLALQFPHSRVQLNNPIQTVLRLRYFACRTIIFRPYIHAVLKDEKLGMDTVVRENCRKCLEACLRQLEHITEHHAGHMPYLWQGALSMVSQSLLVMGATMSPSLAAVLPPADNIDKMLKDVITELQYYAHLAPSLKLALELVQEAEERRRYFLRESGMRI
ncbi:hypothetical protein TWF106_001973 [Orbilia oligospora]|uniref:Zn(2)-C6 fungal-type domain-containing protein n=1 Tax=Orbilia oligospora TaxID=2813651 RepID=A0A6G1M9Q3_ORBOL|nr:hypothetical protein TWF788_009100 [Orbilia oligospora]KAF3203421.1 hypothetical protein TWF106_001973 [Orbilia oligospora]KAF3214947.1 hypothetical protein TWF191_009637 [Orbilia oligospora]KAF3216462.1 hypothetical protein TWF679_003077 [Orbilia oligospora]KAF3251051.1 hypothetical protein TWF192_005029 [Orbilia oligospora]